MPGMILKHNPELDGLVDYSPGVNLEGMGSGLFSAMDLSDDDENEEMSVQAFDMNKSLQLAAKIKASEKEDKEKSE